jgi:hypothetical protein
MEHWWNDTDREKTEVMGEKPVPSATLSTPNPIDKQLETWHGLLVFVTH